MNPTENGTTQQKVVEPRCPRCDKRLKLAASVVPFGPLEAAVFFCGNCERVISVSVLPVPPPEYANREISHAGLIVPPGM